MAREKTDNPYLRCNPGPEGVMGARGIPTNEMSLRDSGARREFETGAVRDSAAGKGRCDLLPLDVVSVLLGTAHAALYDIENFKSTKKLSHLYAAIRSFESDLPTLMLDVGKHFEAGAEKYGENNWKKGIPLHCYLDSAVRHYLKFIRGDMDEPHDRAFVWNLLCAIWTFNHKPELDDVEMDLHEDVRQTYMPIIQGQNDPLGGEPYEIDGVLL